MTGVFLRLICKAQYFHSYSLKNNLSIQLIVVLMQLVHLLLSFRDIFSTVHALIGQKTHVLFKKQTKKKHVVRKNSPTARVPTDPQHFSFSQTSTHVSITR